MSKRIVLLVPVTFDLNLHLPPGLQPHADEARYLLHAILVGRMQRREEDQYIRLKRDYLDRFIPDRRGGQIRDALESAGVIKVDRTFIRGSKCYGYRLLPPHDAAFVRYRPTDARLIAKLKEYRKEASDEIRLPLHRQMRAILKRIRIEESSRNAIEGKGYRASLQEYAIERILGKDFTFVADRFGRVHTNITNLKSSLRRFLTVDGSSLVNLDIVNSQPMIFCLLLINCFLRPESLDKLANHPFSESSNPYNLEIPNISNPVSHSTHSLNQGDIITNHTILHAGDDVAGHNMYDCMQLASNEFSQRFSDHYPQDIIEFIKLCESGKLYESLMQRLDYSLERRPAFKRLFYRQVFFGRMRASGQLTQLFQRDFPAVFQVIRELKRRDYRQLAYLLQAHESKLMLDVIARRIIQEFPGTFVATIHDSILTTPDRAEVIQRIMVEEFARVGLCPRIKREDYSTAT